MIDQDKSKQIFEEVQDVLQKHNLTNAEEMYILNELKMCIFMNRIFSVIEKHLQ